MDRKLGRLIVFGVSAVTSTTSPAGSVYYYATSSPMHCDSVDACTVVASCPVGLYAYGGGARGDQIKVEASRPATVAGLRGWSVRFRGAFSEYGASAHAIATAYVVCSDLSGGYTTTLSPFGYCSAGQQGCVTGAICPTDNVWTQISGGFDADRGKIEFSDGVGTTDGGAAWVMQWFADSTDFGSSVVSEARAYAVCVHAAPTELSYAYGETVPCDHDGPSCTTSVSCPAGSLVIGGGFRGDGSELETSAPTPDRGGWQVSWYPATDEIGNAAKGSGQATATCTIGSLPDAIFAGNFDSI